MSEQLTPTQKATAVDRLASRREGFTGLGKGYSFGVVSLPENPKDLTPEQRKEQTVWGITSWDEDKLGPVPTDEEIEAEAVKEPVPQKVTPRQLKRALIKAGVDPAMIDSAIDAIEDGTERALAKADWHDASFIERGYPLINQFAAGLGLSEEDVDMLFRAAAKE